MISRKQALLFGYREFDALWHTTFTHLLASQANCGSNIKSRNKDGEQFKSSKEASCFKKMDALLSRCALFVQQIASTLGLKTFATTR